MATVSTHTTPVPFWNRLREITLYPIRGAAVITLVTLVVCSLFSMLPAIGWIISILTWLAAYKYAFEILRATADGRLEAPETALSVDDGVVWRMFAMQFIYIVIFFIALAAGGPLFGFLTLAAIVFLQPGCLMSLAIDGNLTHALNPATSFGVVARIGWSYLAVFALLFVIQASAAMAGNWLSHVMPPVLGNLAIRLFSFWGLFATFHLMGYLVYQYHEDLGYEPESHQHALPTLPDRDRELLDRAEAQIRDGHAETALALLRAEIRTRPVTVEAHELYHRLQRQGSDASERDEHTRQFLNLLMLEKQDRRALGLLREALDDDPDFVPMQIADGERLAERARLSGQAQLAVDTLRAMLRKYPKSPNASRWGLEASLLLVDRFGRDDEARELLEQALTRCEDPSLQEKLEAAIKPLRATLT